MATSPARRRLDQERVVTAAETIVDELGWDRLTMAALAAELGTTGPALYNHVSSLEALKGELQNRAMRQLGAKLVSAALGRSGREGFLELARTYRAFVHRYPNRYDGATRTPIDREGLLGATQAANDALHAVVRSYGVPDEDALTAELGTFAALHGAVTLEVSGFFGDVVDLDVLYEMVVAGAERQLAVLAEDNAA